MSCIRKTRAAGRVGSIAATGVTSETGGRHFWKGGIERADGINTFQSSDISSVEIYRAP